MLGKKIFLAICLMIIAVPAWGQSARQLVKEGNILYKNGSYKEALSAYRQAAKKDADSPFVQFDLGNALYKTGDLKGALAAYKKAAAKSRDKKFIAKNQFNQGNAVFGEAQSRLKKDSESALQGMNDSLRYYRDAMRLDPKLTEAATNIEIVKRRINDVKQKIARQQAAREAKKKMAKKLKDMARQQQKMADKSQKKAAGQNSQKASKGAVGQGGDDLTAQQKLQQQTAKMAAKMAKARRKQGDDKSLAKAQKALQSAIDQQKKSVKDLKKQAPAQAAEAQKQAAKKIRQAAESLKDRHKKDDSKQAAKGKNGKKGKKGKSGAGGKKSSKNKRPTAAAKPPESAKQPNPQNGAGNMKKRPPGEETAADLLNEEQRNKAIRQQEMKQSGNSYEAVEKNW